ncbi:hypothetical protein CSUI_003214 [Cystoisospora suis]|uniref:Uncharacterized protein n=1 Tax=Cystoisospora suis TaxID=483139 RepID=A0A2C6L1P4_9APIC|nr:hypothetical protein CSUI_003214 [Cystoisospora suis]
MNLPPLLMYLRALRSQSGGWRKEIFSSPSPVPSISCPECGCISSYSPPARVLSPSISPTCYPRKPNTDYMDSSSSRSSGRYSRRLLYCYDSPPLSLSSTHFVLHYSSSSSSSHSQPFPPSPRAFTSSESRDAGNGVTFSCYKFVRDWRPFSSRPSASFPRSSVTPSSSSRSFMKRGEGVMNRSLTRKAREDEVAGVWGRGETEHDNSGYCGEKKRKQFRQGSQGGERGGGLLKELMETAADLLTKQKTKVGQDFLFSPSILTTPDTEDGTATSSRGTQHVFLTRFQTAVQPGGWGIFRGGDGQGGSVILFSPLLLFLVCPLLTLGCYAWIWKAFWRPLKFEEGKVQGKERRNKEHSDGEDWSREEESLRGQANKGGLSKPTTGTEEERKVGAGYRPFPISLAGIYASDLMNHLGPYFPSHLELRGVCERAFHEIQLPWLQREARSACLATLQSMLQYPAVAENFSASKLPCLLPCHTESERGNEDESPARSVDQQSNGLSEDILGYSSSSLLENIEERENLELLKQRNCGKEKEESVRGKGEQEEEDNGASKEEKEGKDLTSGENDGEVNAHCCVEKKYPLEIHLAVFVNPIEIRGSNGTVTIKKQSTEWMMELSSLLKILHHTPIEHRVVPYSLLKRLVNTHEEFWSREPRLEELRALILSKFLETIGGRLRSGEWHDISRRTIKLMNQLIEGRVKGRKDASPPHDPSSSKSVDKAHDPLSLGPSPEGTQEQTDSPSSLERVARNSAENSKASISAKSVDGLRGSFGGGKPEHALHAGEDRDSLPSSTKDLAHSTALAVLPSSGSSCLPRSSSLSFSETSGLATSPTQSSSLLLVPVPPPQPRQSPPLKMKLFLQDIEAAVGCAFGIVFIGLLSRRTGGEALFADGGKMVLTFLRSLRGIACLEGVYRLERHFIRTPLYHQDEKVMLQTSLGMCVGNGLLLAFVLRTHKYAMLPFILLRLRDMLNTDLLVC